MKRFFIVFFLFICTSGRGNPIGYPIVPVIKVASTGRMYDRMADDIAGVILDGAPMQAVGKEIIDIMRNVLDGEPTKAELNQQEGIVCLYTVHPAM